MCRCCPIDVLLALRFGRHPACFHRALKGCQASTIKSLGSAAAKHGSAAGHPRPPRPAEAPDAASIFSKSTKPTTARRKHRRNSNRTRTAARGAPPLSRAGASMRTATSNLSPRPALRQEQRRAERDKHTTIWKVQKSVRKEPRMAPSDISLLRLSMQPAEPPKTLGTKGLFKS